MRLTLWLFAALAAAGPASAAGQSTRGMAISAAKVTEPATDPSTVQPTTTADAVIPDELPVSLERIRDGLAHPPPPPRLRSLVIKPDFVVYIQEREHIQAILNTLDFKLKSVVRPPGGLYAYAQQQVIGNKTSNPLGQPYAAFSGGELITLAVQGLAQRYLGGKIASAISSAARSYAEHAAEREVAQAIAEYCAARPDGGESLHICRIEAMRR